MTLTSWVTSSRVIWLSPWSSWVRVLANSRRIKEMKKISSLEICTQISIADWNSTLRYLMMLAAAFLSWVSSSGSCITSSRKAITFVFSSLLVSKSWRGKQKSKRGGKKNTSENHNMLKVFPHWMSVEGWPPLSSSPKIFPCLHQPIPSVSHSNTNNTDGRLAHYLCLSEASWQMPCWL